MAKKRLVIAKFGGSALGPDGVHIPRIVERIRELKRDADTKVVAVFSAPLTANQDGTIRSLTDIVLEQGRNAESGAEYSLDTVTDAYAALMRSNLRGATAETAGACGGIAEEGLARTREALEEARTERRFEGEVRSRALAFSGEVLMSHIMKHILAHNGIRSDSVELDNWPIITDSNIESSNFLAEESRKRLGPMEAMLEANDAVSIGGFIGRTTDGTITTYERGGTDRTAADVAILFHKEYDASIDFEKDSSVVSADPKIVKDDLSEVPQLSYNEARLAGMFGMKILDPIAIKEIVENGADVPIIITNLNRPEKTTTITRALDPDGSSSPIKMVTGKSNCAIFRIEKAAMERLLTSLENDKRYSEFVILSPYTKDGTEFGRMLFLDADYIRRNEKYFMAFDSLATITYNRGVVTLIGDEMWRAQQVASRASACVGSAGLNILNMDAQEETSRIIIVIEDAADNVARAIASIHGEIVAAG